MPTLFFEFRMLSGLRPRFNRIMAGGSDLCNIAVIPAKAGIQVLNGIARLARDLKSYVRVAPPLRPISVERPAAACTCGWLTHGRFLFFARAKKRNQKKARPGAPAGCAGPLRSSPHQALDQLAGRKIRASGSNTVSLKSSRWGCGTRRALRGPENINTRHRLYFSNPIWRAFFLRTLLLLETP